MKKAASIFSLFCGVSMFVVWGILLVTGRVVELRTEPFGTIFLLGAEFLTSISLLIGGFGLLSSKSWGLRTDLAALGMLLYCTVFSIGVFGQQGNIVIQSPISPASGKIIPLGQKPLITTTLLSQRCAALAGGNASSFTVAGRDALPAEPGGWVPTPLALAALSAGTGQEERGNGDAEEAPLLSLRKIAPPGFLTQSFAVDSSAGCAS